VGLRHARLDPAHALTTQARSRRHPEGRGVARVDLGLDPLGAEVLDRVVGEQTRGPRGVPPAAMSREQPPRQLGHLTAGPRLDPADERALDLDAVSQPGPRRPLVGPARDHVALVGVRRPLRLPEPPHDLLVVPVHGRPDVSLGPRAEHHDAVGEGFRRVGHASTLATPRAARCAS
jgi:hypothetical protein